MGLLEQELILSALLNPAVYGENIDKVEKIETHISCVFLAGAYAYKIKKAINLGFLDFSKLDARHYYCQEELRLNRRFSKTLYLDVIAITGTPDQPTLGGAGPIIEYAVKMRRFAQEQLLDRLSALDLLTPEHIDQLADTLVKFHASTAVSSIADSYGAAPTLCKPALENFAQIKSTPNHEHERTVLDELEKWTGDQCNKLEGVFEKRKRQARIRECHGDCHLGNLVVINGVVTLFDCLEFDQNLRWIDVMNEVAFVYMDLLDRKQAKLARRFLNRYLELSGDYGGLYVLRFYVVYRAMVRAKVHCLRANQSGIGTDKAASLLDQYREYLILAKQHIGESFPAIIITHGFSGSGKTTLTQFLLEFTGAVRLRSDVERKRLHGLPALARTGADSKQGIYTSESTTLTYQRLLQLTESIINAAYPVLVDATFLKHSQRDAFRRLAIQLQTPFIIIDFAASENTLRQRIAERQQQANDASEADVSILEQQLRTCEPLQVDELAVSLRYDTEQPLQASSRKESWTSILKKLDLSDS